jgi:N-acyl-D-amino-acid deacylase
MSEANVMRAMREEFVSVCTDVGPAGDSRIASHPRAFGAFPRVLARYVREYGVISLERAIAKMSSVAANDLLLYDRGRLAPGLAADVVVFNAAKIADRATLGEPHQMSQGMQYVIVNGKVVFEEGKYTGQRPGRVLRGPGYKQRKTP